VAKLFAADYSYAEKCGPQFDAFYRYYFLGVREVWRADKGADVGGVDKYLSFDGDRQHVVGVQEKARRGEYDYGDLYLEYVTNAERGRAGWIEQVPTSDYLCYAFPAANRYYLYPSQQLYLSYQRNKVAWHKEFQAQECREKSPGDLSGTSWGLLVPHEAVHAAIAAAFGPISVIPTR